MKLDKKRLTAALANGAEYLAMGEIAAHTGLIVSQAPRNNANFDIIVNNHDLTTGCRIEVKHSRTDFKANIKGSDYDFLVFVYAPSNIDKGRIDQTVDREVYVFPRHVVEATDSGKTGTNFNPKYVTKWQWYKDKYFQILEHVMGIPQMSVIGTRGDERYLVATEGGRGFVADLRDSVRYPEMMIATIAKFGYWEEMENDPELIEQIKVLPMQQT